MQTKNLNLRQLQFLVADGSSYSCRIVRTVLKTFGAHEVVEARNIRIAEEIMRTTKIDALLCDYDLPDAGGIEFVRSIRGRADHPCRSAPILIMANEATLGVIGQARDAGAHLVISKPVAPSVLYDRLFWIAYRARNFVEFPGYYGPDRRFKFDGYVHGKARRKDDLSQEQISNLIASMQQGNSSDAA